MAITGCGNQSSVESDTNDSKMQETTEKQISANGKETTTADNKKEEKTTEKFTVNKENTTKNEEIKQEITQDKTLVSSVQQTEEYTERMIETITEASTETHTEKPTKAPVTSTQTTETATTAPKYDVNSEKYQNEVKRLTVYYINQYRTSGGNVPLTESNSASVFAQGRSEQLKTHFAHDTNEIRALATQMEYGIYRDPKEYGDEGEPYWEPWGIEAITTFAGNQGNSADEIAQHIARNFYNSKEHWNYVGGTVRPYTEYVYCGIGVTYRAGGWYCCFIVQDERHDN